MYRSFFLAVHGSAELDFQPSKLFGESHFMQGTFKDFDFKIREFKVYRMVGREQQEMFGEEETYN